MFLVLIYYVFLLSKVVLGALFIDVKNPKFDGEDKGILAALKKRMSYDNQELLIQLPSDDYVEKNLPYDSAQLLKMQELEKSGRRRMNDFIPARDDDLKWHIIQFMQNQIYATQYRMKHLQKIVDKYAGDINFRVAFIYNRVDTLIKEMRILYTVMFRGDSARSVYDNLIYYTYILKKNIDVNYIHDYMIRLHTIYMMMHARLQTTKKPEVKGKKKPAEGEGGEAAQGEASAAPEKPAEAEKTEPPAKEAEAEAGGEATDAAEPEEKPEAAPEAEVAPEAETAAAEVVTTVAVVVTEATTKKKTRPTTRQLHEYNDYYNKK